MSRFLVIALSLLFLAGDAILWFFSATTSGQVRAAFVGAASAWVVAFIGIASGITSAWWVQRSANQATLSDERRSAYAKLISISEAYREAAEDRKTSARELKRLLGIKDNPPDDLQQMIVDERSHLDTATARADAKHDEYRHAYAIAELLAPKKVYETLRIFRGRILSSESVYTDARTAFRNAVRTELGQGSISDG
jgi:hypothetical protein